ncbi:MFS general substrate transporter [Punctularia strigosozonata HHB-11173 SS5]|uniref:MFS general substrate transporter n=1 Tax=Punctularia strigosozonata (strain HHB-11173) TaxID=741275 RepID=UPI0004416CB2|nr:MFS general substrate transporter [Punctularia strigosozonata HHB-11173 SS5]EIN13004.1 MFS general substrate transporter [Punctularia strigosozonata HHB-11173 SS5]
MSEQTTNSLDSTPIVSEAGQSKTAAADVEKSPVEPAAPAPPPALDFPDGGFRAWLTVCGSWFALFATFGYINAFGVYQDYYTRIYLNNVSASTVSWIGSFQFFVPLIMGLWAGRLFDGGYFRPMMLIGSLLFTFSLFMLSLANKHQYYQVFLAQAVGMGLGLGLVFTPSVSIPTHYFRRRRALASGIALSGSSVGAIIHPILLNQLFSRIGFHGAVRASGYMILGCLVIANLTMRTRIPPRKAGGPMPTSLKTLFSDVAYVLTITGSFFCQITVYFPAFYIQLYAVEHGVDLNLAFYSVAILNAGSVIGRILPNFFADKIGPFKLVIPCTIICSGLMFSLLGIKNTGSMVAVAAVYGIASGAYLALIVAVVASLSRSPAEIGLRVGVAFSTNSFAALVGIPIAGALLGTGSTNDLHWTRAIIFSCVCVAVGAACFIAAAWHASTRRK